MLSLFVIIQKKGSSFRKNFIKNPIHASFLKRILQREADIFFTFSGNSLMFSIVEKEEPIKLFLKIIKRVL